MDQLRISTITAILKLSQRVDLKKVYDGIPILDGYIPFIEYGVENGYKGFSIKLTKKKRKKKSKKTFYNQVTIHIIHDGKIMNVKMFNNGRIQITGLKNEKQPIDLVGKFLLYLKDLNIVEEEAEIIDNDIVLINSDFDMGYEISRDILHRDIIEADIYSSYEPCIYPGVNIKFFINEYNYEQGICSCYKMCNGKGNGCGDGNCKKVTIAVFKSGKIIITGGRNREQIEKSYNFIKKFIDSNKERYVLK
tara:strand:- start:3572 stop:4318 length:747 start_codon:yes stop_codon:yes gene_type:complete